MRSIGLAAAVALATAACGGSGGGGAGGSTGGGGGNPPPPTSCNLDWDCTGTSQICEAGVCTHVVDDGTNPILVAYGPRTLTDVGVSEPLWFRFDEPMRIAPGGFVLSERSGSRQFTAAAELSADQRTLTLRFPGVVAPLDASLSLNDLTDLSGRHASASWFDVSYRPWWPLTQDLTAPQTTSADLMGAAVDGAGGVIAAWRWSSGSYVQQLHAKRWDGAAWTDLGLLNVDPAFDATSPRVAASGSAVVIAFVQGSATGNHVVVRRWTEGAGWSDPIGGTVTDSAGGGDPALTLDSAGNPFVVFTVPGGQGQGTQLLVRSWNGTTWGAVGAGALNQSAAHWAESPSIVLDSSGQPIVAFQETTTSYLDRDLNVKLWNGSAWVLAGGSAPATLTSADGSSPQPIAIAPDGRLAVAWMDDARALHARFLDTSSWSAIESLGPAYLPGAPWLLAGPDGLWAGYGASGAAHAAHRSDAGWTDVGPTTSVYTDAFWCEGGPFASAPTFGPVILCTNSAPAMARDVGVYAVNR